MHLDSSTLTKPVASSFFSAPPGQMVAQGASAQCWHERRPKAHFTPLSPPASSWKLISRRVSPFKSIGLWYEPVEGFPFFSRVDGRPFQHLQATWQPRHAVQREESNNMAFSLIAHPSYAFSMSTRNALYSGTQQFGSAAGR